MAFSVPINCVGFLQEYCLKNFMPLPIYTEDSVTGSDHCKKFTTRCKIEEHSVTGTATTKKAAKQDAAKNMITLLQDKNYFQPAPVKVVQPVQHVPQVNLTEKANGSVNTEIKPSSDIDFRNPIGILQEFASKNQLRSPVYNDIPEMQQFTISCSFQNNVTYGCGPQKKLAKAAAASAMLKKLRDEKGNIQIDPNSVVAAGATDNSRTVQHIPNITDVEKDPNMAVAVDTTDNSRKHVSDTTDVEKKSEVIHIKPAVEVTKNVAGDETTANNDIQRFRDLYHNMSQNDPEKWLKMFCEMKKIDIPVFELSKSKVDGKRACTIEIPSASIKLERYAETKEEARKDCCRIAGFILLMRDIDEYKKLFNKNHVRAHKKNNSKPGKGRQSNVLVPFVHLENWLNTACQEAGIVYPTFEYHLVGGFYQSSCRLFMLSTTGTGESKKVAKNIAVTKLQTYLLDSANITEKDDDLVKSSKVIDLLTQIKNEIQQEREVNLDEVIEAYKNLLTQRTNMPHHIKIMNVDGYSNLHGPAVTKILNLNIDEINNCGFEYIKNLATEQKLILKIDYFCNTNQMKYTREGKYLCTIFIEHVNLPRLTFMGNGDTKNESLGNATKNALTSLKIFLYKLSTPIENMIYLDSLNKM